MTASDGDGAKPDAMVPKLEQPSSNTNAALGTFERIACRMTGALPLLEKEKG
jgi:hypothetical protein